MRLNRGDQRSRYAKLVLADTGLVACWPMEELNGSVVRDARGTNHSSSSSGLTRTPQVPMAAAARASTLAAGFIRIPDANALDLGDGPLSIEFWVKRGATGVPGNGYILSKGTFGSAHVYIVFFNNADLLHFATSLADASLIRTATNITDTTRWHHVVFTKSGATSHAYLDGVVSETAGTNQILVDSATQLSIGEESGGGTNFTGSLSWIALYKRVLSPVDVRAHYVAALAQS